MEFAASVPEFRKTDKDNIHHRLDGILILILLAHTSKCVGRAEIIEFSKHNLRRFRTMGMLKNGIPSEATLCRVEQGVDDHCLTDFTPDYTDGLRKCPCRRTSSTKSERKRVILS